MDRRVGRGQVTRGHLIEVATQLFADVGFEGTSIEMVLRESGVSRGALYHHFESKEALFIAVLEAIEERLVASVVEASNAAPPERALIAGCNAWLELAARDPMVRRIVLIDAPAVMGWQAWREIDDRYGLGLLKAGFGALAAAGRIRSEQADFYAHMLLAVLVETAFLIARADDPEAAMTTGREAVERVLGSLIGEG